LSAPLLSTADCDPADLESALTRAGLPVSDLREPGRRFFRFSDDKGLVGFAGLQGCGADRLLRSLVIMEERRNSGRGGAVVSAMEAAAIKDGATALHLLTTGARTFFAARGYEIRKRDRAPESIRGTREFTHLCPGSAAYMVKVLCAERPAAARTTPRKAM
jgi:amino-acid N-acetyltransferase